MKTSRVAPLNPRVILPLLAWLAGGSVALAQDLSPTTPSSEQFTIGGSISPALDHPRGLAVDCGGNIYVADSGNNRMVKFSSEGTLLRTWGSAGSATGEFSRPVGVATDSRNDVYVADSGNSRIQKFDSRGAYLAQWTCSNPAGVAIDGQDRVYVSSTGVQKFDSDGALLSQWDIDTTPFARYTLGGWGGGWDSGWWGWGSWGAWAGGWDWGWDFGWNLGPGGGSGGGRSSGVSGSVTSAGIAVDGDGNVYVAIFYQFQDLLSGWTGRVSGAGIEKFTSDGAYVDAWGNFVHGSDVAAPEGLAVDGANYVYAADLLNNCIDKFTREGASLTEWGITGGTLGALSAPRGVAVDRSRNMLYVADTGNNRILALAIPPALKIQATGGQGAVLSWPAAALGYSLQQNSALGTGNWENVTNAVRTVGNENQVVIAPLTGNNFYRLVRP